MVEAMAAVFIMFCAQFGPEWVWSGCGFDPEQNRISRL